MRFNITKIEDSENGDVSHIMSDESDKEEEEEGDASNDEINELVAFRSSRRSGLRPVIKREYNYTNMDTVNTTITTENAELRSVGAKKITRNVEGERAQNQN